MSESNKPSKPAIPPKPYDEVYAGFPPKAPESMGRWGPESDNSVATGEVAFESAAMVSTALHMVNEMSANALFDNLVDELFLALPQVAWIEELEIKEDQRRQLADLIIHATAQAMLQAVSDNCLRKAECGREN